MSAIKLLEEALRSIEFAQRVARVCGPQARQDELTEHLRVASARIDALLKNGGWMPVNMNDSVKIRLTECGLNIHRMNHDELYRLVEERGGKFHDYTPPVVDADGWHKNQLWCVMHDYGPHITMGCEIPFETGIEVEAKPLPPLPEAK